jgi:hypothetical protein
VLLSDIGSIDHKKEIGYVLNTSSYILIKFSQNVISAGRTLKMIKTPTVIFPVLPPFS